MNEEVLAETVCPHCNHPIDAATGLLDENARPKENDASVCAYCAGLVSFNADGTLRKMSDEEFVDLPLDVRLVLADARRYFLLRAI